MKMPWVIFGIKKYLHFLKKVVAHGIIVEIIGKIFRRKRYFISKPRAASCTSSKLHKGSLTVEAALILPLFFMGMLALICVMDLQRIKTEINISLNESVKELGMYAFALGEGESESPIGKVDDALCMVYAQSKLKKDKQITLQTLRSSYEQNRVELWVTGHYKVPVALLPLPRIPFQNRVRVHDWTGYHGDDDKNENRYNEMVYVSDYQSVYHTSAQCSHLSLTIIKTMANQVGNERNENGGKYHECSYCIMGGEHIGIVYITPTGDRFHQDAQCQSLKRSTKLVPKETLGHISQCSRC